jgi:hypothetical protein
MGADDLGRRVSGVKKLVAAGKRWTFLFCSVEANMAPSETRIRGKRLIMGLSSPESPAMPPVNDIDQRPAGLTVQRISGSPAKRMHQGPGDTSRVTWVEMMTNQKRYCNIVPLALVAACMAVACLCSVVEVCAEPLEHKSFASISIEGLRAR